MTPLQTKAGKSGARHPDAGFSLIEIMVTLLIVSILFVTATPGLQDFILRSRIKNFAYDMMGDMALARAEAVTRSTRIGIVSIGQRWSGGYQLFNDLNQNGQLDASGNCTLTDECVFFTREAPNGSLSICSTGSSATITSITFGPDGRVRAYDGSTEVTGIQGFRLAPRTSTAQDITRELDLSPAGRVSIFTSNERCPS